MGVVGDIAGAIIGGNASKKAAKAQERMGREAIAEERRQYDLTRQDLAPWRQAGGAAIQAGAAMLQPGYDYTASPGYQFRFNEGQRAVEGGAASKGMLMSGGTLKDLTRFGQGVAADDFNDQFNRQMAIAGGGQQAATSLGQLGGAMAGRIGDTLTGIGNARASGYMGQANAWINGINNVDSRLSQLAGIFGGGM
jgi:hypothetical protein